MQKRIAPRIVFAYLLVTFLLMLAAPVLFINWTRQPFIGAFVENTLVLNRNSPTTDGTWALYDSERPFGYQITTIDGQTVTNYAHFRRILAFHKVGDELTLGLDYLQTPDDEQELVAVTLQEFPLDDQLVYFYIPYLIGWVFLASSIWVFFTRYRDFVGQTFAVFTASVALIMGLFFDENTSNYLVWFWTMGLVVSSWALVNLTFLYPVEEGWLLRRIYISWLIFLPAIVMMIIASLLLYNMTYPLAHVTLWLVTYALLVISIVVFLVYLSFRQRKFISPIAREQTRLTLLGALFAFGPVTFWLILMVTRRNLPFPPWLFLFFAIFPVMMAYSILRYRMVRADYWVSRTVLYSSMTLLAAGGYAFLSAGASLIFGSVVPIYTPYLLGVAAFFFALLFHPVRSFLLRRIDTALNRGKSAYQEQLQVFGHELTQEMELKQIIERLRRTIEENLFPSALHIFVQDSLSDTYLASAGNDGRPTSDLRFPLNGALVTALAERHTSIFLGEGVALPMSLAPEQARLSLLGAKMFVPMLGRQRLTGWIALGLRLSGDPYNSRDLKFLEALCDQTALAIERAQVMEDLEHRMRAMNVLTRVSQGINITLDFNDMLELIYAQTNQMIPTQDFCLTLLDNYSGLLYHVFCLENDERLQEKENRLLPSKQGLEQDIIRDRRTLVTDDYEGECRSRGVNPSVTGEWYAWLGVPLNAGAETIGVVSLASREPTVTFITEQVDLLQAVADQAAGAIVKARLLQETERRARQLSMLNEVARGLTSTLELGPLLNQILKNAVEILSCEAGSLLLVDQQTQELVFEVVVGPVDLVGQRLPPGTGLVGKAVEACEPIIANDARRTKEWYDKDEETGFITKDLLVVPMQVKDRVIGVIEVINRKDDLPFTPSDQELLMAFTSQAAIAIENARLYTQTDQTLAARVEELSVMQRIDRELNASLDIQRAMRITLEWAMRQSGVDAGLIGVIDEDGLQVMASEGYTSELAAYKDALMPVDLPGMRDAIQSGQSQYLLVGNGKTGDAQYQALLQGGISQIALPIRQENQTIGIMLLESVQAEDAPDETREFLSRLTDHAAIAIANAQLYAQVEAANQSKVDFVRFVVHELQNPMSSIKGFNELVLGGTAGPVNEMQASFLSTVRSNVDRMATIVSDLKDVTQIEGGKLPLNFKVLPIIEVIDETSRSLGRQIEEKKQALVLEIPDDLPKVWVDPVRLTQIITNLISNAHKYTPQGGQITVGCELTKLEADGSSGELSMMHVWVKDDGIGINDEDQQRIFQQYFRTESSKDMATGTGLGLNITKSLVEMQGGSIWFESEQNMGTTFHFTVPIAEETA